MPKILHMHKKVVDDIVVSYEEIVDTSCLLLYYYRNAYYCIIIEISKIWETDIKNCTCYFFDDFIWIISR